VQNENSFLENLHYGVTSAIMAIDIQHKEFCIPLGDLIMNIKNNKAA